MFFGDMKKYLSLPYFSINDNKKYVMIEFRLIGPPINYVDTFYDLILKGYKPILAHPERINGLYNDRTNLIKLLKMGVFISNKYRKYFRIIGNSCKNYFKKYLENNWIHLLGSDAHSLNFRRGFSMQKGIEHISKYYPNVNLREILETNPKAVINGEHVEVDISNINFEVKSTLSYINKLIK